MCPMGLSRPQAARKRTLAVVYLSTISRQLPLAPTSIGRLALAPNRHEQSSECSLLARPPECNHNMPMVERIRRIPSNLWVWVRRVCSGRMAIPVGSEDRRQGRADREVIAFKRVRMISRFGERAMRIVIWSLVVVFSSVLLGCNTAPAQDRSVAAKGEPPRSFGKLAPYTAGTDPCQPYQCAVTVFVDDNCNVTVPNPVLNLLGAPPSPRLIVWVISDSKQDHVFAPVGSNPPPLVVNKSGANDPAFGMPAVTGPYMMVKFYNNYPRLSHEYGLNVVKTDGTKCPTYDPWVIE